MTTPVSTQPQGRFSLIDHHGRRVTDEDFRGKFLMVFFGFTHCRQICPAVLRRNTEALDLLGQAARRIRPLYVSVDPERDTPEVMRAFLTSSYPHHTGLTGTPSEVEAAKAAYRVFARRGSDLDEYDVPHTSFTYLMGPDGTYLAHYPDTLSPDELAARVRGRLATPGAPSGPVAATASTASSRGRCCG
ncbi:copper-binding protein [Streptomyces spiralis]|uniref:Copper-binding protein n=1 Tax=Streptomyces spiralis TaxID=66376 RepID=A0A919AJ25_9ACTN|nr:SCO family protein [Streptomyces spiralis]GHF09501.1 copper-binding protein [Streptomyces spiralis]